MSVIVLRPVHPGERSLVEGIFERLSPLSRYRRFLSPSAPVADHVATLVSGDGGGDRAAWVAVEVGEHGQTGVGLAHYSRDESDPTRADVALAVVDDHQHQRIGTRLVRALGETARRNGISTFTGHVLWDNGPMRAMLAKGGARLSLDEPGVLRFELSVPAARTERVLAPGDRQPA